MDNVPEFSVSELSGKLKTTIEDAFGYIRVRGELGRVTRAGSGHVYLDLKDDRAVLSSVIWKGSAGRLKVAPEQGMEVICTGRLTTFAGQSRYQMVIDTLEPAGVGALMALLEARKKSLSAEGLFDESLKKKLPFLPRTIGVVTSPSGAVIRDILHRLRDRFPVHVIVWPTLVQGETAAPKIISGIEGFNALPSGGPVPRPDVLIVARGGGSLEDLWCFNDEGVVRAVASSDIPVISAVGHETDTTLIDYASDRRAPTPTAAAEMAVPVRQELIAQLAHRHARLAQAASRSPERARLALSSAIRGLGAPDRLLEVAVQRYDLAVERLRQALNVRLARAEARFAATRLAVAPLERRVSVASSMIDSLSGRLVRRTREDLHQRAQGIEDRGRLLSSFSYRGVLDRGFVLAETVDGQLLPRASKIGRAAQIKLRFADGEVLVSPQLAPRAKGKASPADKASAPTQAGLFGEEEPPSTS